MPIVIPSKKIYSIENKKVLSNKIDALEINTISPHLVLNEDVSLFSSSIGTDLVDSNEKKTDYEKGFYQTSVSNIISESASYVELQTKYLRNYRVQIPKKMLNGSFVNSVKSPSVNVNYLAKEEGIEVSNVTKSGVNITTRWTISQTSESGKIPAPQISTGRVPQGGMGSSSAEIVEEDETSISEVSDEGDHYEFTINGLLVGLYTLEAGYAYQQAVNGINRNGSGKIVTYDPISIDINVNGSVLKMEISEEVKRVGAVGENTVNISKNSLIQKQNYFADTALIEQDPLTIDENYDVTRKYESGYSVDGVAVQSGYKMTQQFIPYDGADEFGEDICVIYIYNINQFGLDNIPNGSCLIKWGNNSAIGTVYYRNYDEGNGNFINISYVGNKESLYQQKDFYVDYICTKAITKNYQKTIDDYNFGKDKIVLLCEIGEYYDENGKVAISTLDNEKDMLIENGEIVSVMNYGEFGEDVPISFDNNGNPTLFRVIKSKIIYDGAVWQELTLQEV